MCCSDVNIIIIIMVNIRNTVICSYIGQGSPVRDALAISTLAGSPTELRVLWAVALRLAARVWALL